MPVWMRSKLWPATSSSQWSHSYNPHAPIISAKPVATDTAGIAQSPRFMFSISVVPPYALTPCILPIRSRSASSALADG